MVQRQPLEGIRRTLVYATLGIGLLLVIKPYRCDKCGHRWESR
jgi:hypothetical protein